MPSTGRRALLLSLGCGALACSDPADSSGNVQSLGGSPSSFAGGTSAGRGGGSGGQTASSGAPGLGGASGSIAGKPAGASGTAAAGGAAMDGGRAGALGAGGTFAGAPAGGRAAASGGTGTAGGGAAGGGAAGAENVGGAGFSGSPGGGRGGESAAGTSGTGTGGAGASGVCTGTPAKAVTVFMIGDSTMSVYDADLYPRMGWGQPLGDLFDAKCATVSDKALSGRSSKSFYDEGAWTPVKNALKAGDYVFIQFGHNDEKSEDSTRYTEPQTTFKQYLTTYITDTRDKGATPLLLTPINRNNWSGTKLQDSHGAYPPAMRELAADLSVELVDLTALTKTYFERIGQTETTKLFMDLAPGQFPNYPNGNDDNTHLQETGARLIGLLAMADAYAQNLTVASFLAAVPTAP